MNAMVRRAAGLAAVGVLVVILMAGQAHGAPIVSGGYTETAGVFTYRYAIDNLGPEGIYDFGLFFVGNPLQVGAPDGWDRIAGEGFIDWFSLDPSADIAPGAALGGFWFTSVLGPDAITYLALGWDPVVAEQLGSEYAPADFRGETTGPSAVPVPEPTTLLTLAAGLATLGAVRRRRG
jgi:hypothetical protein